MKVLLDTNIIIHREANRILKKEIGVLFNWLDRLHYSKHVHPLSLYEIRKHSDAQIVATIEAKSQNYNLLKTQSPELDCIQKIRKKYDNNENDSIDTSLLKEIFCNRIDILITEDRKIHVKANELKISDRVFTIDSFLEKVNAENPSLADYQVLSVKKEYFGNLDINDPFFNSLKIDYKGFDQWFNRKAEEIAYVCRSDSNDMLAFLYLKVEEKTENYDNIVPVFTSKRRLKIGTFKVILNGYKLGERFLKIVFDNAIRYEVGEIYVTIFDKTPDQQRLIYLLEDWGFKHYGFKQSSSGKEGVFVREFSPNVDINNPRKSYPYLSSQKKIFIAPIYPAYHTELFPDSILNNESPNDFVENRPNRNAIQKVYISRSYERNLAPGDIIVFYRTGGYYKGVVSTIGLVESITDNIKDEESFVRFCRKRSVFTDEELRDHWNYRKYNHPFVVNFLYVYSLPKRPNLKRLIELGIISDTNSVPRGFEEITNVDFRKILMESKSNENFIVD